MGMVSTSTPVAISAAVGAGWRRGVRTLFVFTITRRSARRSAGIGVFLIMGRVGMWTLVSSVVRSGVEIVVINRVAIPATSLRRIMI